MSEISDFPAIMNCTFEVESADVKKIHIKLLVKTKTNHLTLWCFRLTLSLQTIRILALLNC